MSRFSSACILTTFTANHCVLCCVCTTLPFTVYRFVCLGQKRTTGQRLLVFRVWGGRPRHLRSIGTRRSMPRRNPSAAPEQDSGALRLPGKHASSKTPSVEASWPRRNHIFGCTSSKARRRPEGSVAPFTLRFFSYLIFPFLSLFSFFSFLSLSFLFLFLFLFLFFSLLVFSSFFLLSSCFLPFFFFLFSPYFFLFHSFFIFSFFFF